MTGLYTFMNSIKHFHTYINANVKLARIMSTIWTQISSHISCVCQRSTFYNFFGKGAANKKSQTTMQRQKQIQLAFMAKKTITFNRIPSSSRHQLYFTLVLSGNLIIVFKRVDLLFTHSSLCTTKYQKDIL